MSKSTNSGEQTPDLSVFERLSAINVNEHVEQKDNLSYLSWAWAWSEVKKAYPDTTYRVLETEFEESLGFMCHTSVTIKGETLDMWLPVMDGKNKAMKKTAYTYKGSAWVQGKKVEVDKTVEPATMFDINKTIMRCLVKNLAMFGLGIYIYAGEDLPEVESNAKAAAAAPPKKEEPKGDDLIELKKGTPNWDAVTRYVTANKALGVEKIGAQLVRKYKINPALRKEIANLITTA